MRFEEFESFVKDEPGLEGALQRAAEAGKRAGEGTGDSYGLVLSTAVGFGALVLLFPIVKRVLYRIGLPWLVTAERYSELWRGEAERWLDDEYVKRGLDPAVSRAASEALLKEIESTTVAESREAWERLMGILQKDEGAGGGAGVKLGSFRI